MTLPNLLIVGTGRAGTTATLTVLSCHPDIWMYIGDRDPNPNKRGSEIHFFGGAYDKGLEWYAAHFDQEGVDYDHYKYIGEKSPSYVNCVPKPAPRIKEVLGSDVKLVYCVRDPAERCFSQWAHLQSCNYGKWWDTYTRASFSEAIRDRSKTWIPQRNLLLQYSDYARQYSDLLEVFHKDQIHVMVNEETKLRPILKYGELFNWLEVDPYDVTEGKRVTPMINISHYNKYGHINDEDREYLNNNFRKSKDEFYNLLGREVKLWEY